MDAAKTNARDDPRKEIVSSGAMTLPPLCKVNPHHSHSEDAKEKKSDRKHE